MLWVILMLSLFRRLDESALPPVWLIMRSRLHKMALFFSHCCRHAISLQ